MYKIILLSIATLTLASAASRNDNTCEQACQEQYKRCKHMRYSAAIGPDCDNDLMRCLQYCPSFYENVEDQEEEEMDLDEVDEEGYEVLEEEDEYEVDEDQALDFVDEEDEEE